MEEEGNGSVSEVSPISLSSTSGEDQNVVRQENDDRGSRTREENHRQQWNVNTRSILYRVNISIMSNMARASLLRDDVWTCLVVVLTFWLFASMTMILGFYGSMNVQLGPNCSRLLKTNPFFVQTIKVQGLDELKSGPVLYGFYKAPALDVEISWNESHNTFVPEWVYYLNQGSKVDISYIVKSKNSLPLSLVIAQGKESLAEWIGDPSYPNTTLSWNIISGTGNIQQQISMPCNYYIAVGNLNSEEVEVELELRVKALVYDTRKAYHRCSLINHLCSLKLFLLGTNVAVLTSPGPPQYPIDENWYVKLSYGPRWIIYFVGTGVLTAIILLVLLLCNIYQNRRQQQGSGGVETETGAPLLTSQKDDDLSSWGSSHEYNSQDEDDLLPSSKHGDHQANDDNLRRLCAICWDAPRECFFLPCGHCVACFTCATRIADEEGICPVCRRKMKKVRKIFTV
ncbi:E3 ubiquitin-protein ligase APD2-like [Rutidosis leptorrhynchoides]|uniref:E3 ubiquitin-protein ligase APD2-like n=1 Tax=Rutidosis leptorrhynchoides TaxID=125765 RepID=UPI003A98FFFB